MNFLQRRKILKRINYLSLVPVCLMDFETGDDGRINLLLPRFKSNILQNHYKNSKKGEYIRIHLDPLGSSIWQLIDGNANVTQICEQLKITHPEQLQPIEETERRVTQFLSRLYQERYITFTQLMVKNVASG
jgi:hypothetical protein